MANSLTRPEQPSARVRSFVVRELADDLGFEDLTVASGDLLDVPGAVSTFAQDIIDNRGRIVGSWTDASGVTRGFIATPIREDADRPED